LPELVGCIEAIGDQPSFPRKKSERIDRGQSMARCQRDNEGAVREGHHVGCDDEAAIGLARHRCNGAFDLGSIMHIEANQI
jgi:hypothetical protein